MSPLESRGFGAVLAFVEAFVEGASSLVRPKATITPVQIRMSRADLNFRFSEEGETTESLL